MKTIIFATDLTPSSTQALDWAQMLAKQYRATMHLVHVHTPNAAVPIVPGIGVAVSLNTFPPNDNGLTSAQLAEIAQHIAQAGIPVQTHYRAGNIEDEISTLALTIQADLIITGRQAMDSFFDRLLGTTASDIAKGANCPVLVVPVTNGERPVQLKRVAFALQLEGNDTTTLRSVLELVSHAGASLTLVHVEAENQPNLYNDALAINELKDAVGQDAFTIHKVKARTVSGGLSDYLDKHPTDLLVMTTRERSFPDSLLSPSLTSRMLEHASIPVLVYQA